MLPAVAGGGSSKASKKTKVARRPPEGGKEIVFRAYLTFDEKTTTRPMIYELIKKFDVVPNIRTASCKEDMAIMSLSITGDEEEIDRACKWLRKEGVRIDPVEMNVVES
ncbi:MAG: NIL domain-containing protein [Planctomycetota bacterium]|nr:NIL domain-containing protein [Planctomycetota bacterium]